MNAMRKLISSLLPHPFVSVLVALFWLMLAQSATFYDLCVATALAIVIPQMVRSFIIPTPKVRWSLALKLFFVVLRDILVSNVRVARQVLGSTQKLKPKWYRVPLDTSNDHVNTLLAMIITTTPGTVTAGIDQERGDILVHALSCDDIDADILDIKTRYEAPLIAIFHVEQGEQS